MNNGLDTDVCMRKLYIHLVSDFRTSLGEQYASRPLGLLLQGGIPKLRDYQFPSRHSTSPNLFKMDYQLESLFKRYRFKEDVLTEDVLLLQSKDKFLQTQARLSSGFVVTPMLHTVLQRARHHASRILGSYDEQEHMSLCRFGKRACVGSTYAESNLDSKLSKPLTGSHDHIRWFKNYLLTDNLLGEAIRDASGKRRPSYNMCDTLTMSFVPKSFKALRSIVPDTLLGSFYTNGLGRVLAERLKHAGLNIKRLQVRHGVLARKASRDRKLVTADLSAASDSITLHLLRRILPLPWYRKVIFGRIPKLNILGSIVRTETVVTMGLGHTFPLQTLIFYCLLKAIADLVIGPESFISVYGDDLIYPRTIHKYVKVIFPQLLLILNGDKTYAVDYFRESCGSDYYHGFDVRPFAPEGGHQLLNRLEYSQFLYKIANGLLRRWSREEIPKTLEFLLCELILHTDGIFCVPPDYPETSGLKVRSFDDGYFIAPLKEKLSTQAMIFPTVRKNMARKPAISQLVYYWETLRKNSLRSEDPDIYSDAADEPILFWHKCRTKRKRHSDTRTDFRFKPYVVDKQRSWTTLSEGSTTIFGLPLQYAKIVADETDAKASKALVQSRHALLTCLQLSCKG